MFIIGWKLGSEHLWYNHMNIGQICNVNLLENNENNHMCIESFFYVICIDLRRKKRY